jgi:hypothetical protein
MINLEYVKENATDVITRCNDLEYFNEHDEYTDGIVEAMEKVLKIMDEDNIFTYGLERLKKEAQEDAKSWQLSNMAKKFKLQGMEYAYDFFFFEIDLETLFDGYPTEDDICEKYGGYNENDEIMLLCIQIKIKKAGHVTTAWPRRSKKICCQDINVQDAAMNGYQEQITSQKCARI